MQDWCMSTSIIEDDTIQFLKIDVKGIFLDGSLFKRYSLILSESPAIPKSD